MCPHRGFLSSGFLTKSFFLHCFMCPMCATCSHLTHVWWVIWSTKYLGEAYKLWSSWWCCCLHHTIISSVRSTYYL
jgi:hypothetical protein